MQAFGADTPQKFSDFLVPMPKFGPQNFFIIFFYFLYI